MKSHLKRILTSTVFITAFAFALRMLLLCHRADDLVHSNLPVPDRWNF
jgi:hypothetical protein